MKKNQICKAVYYLELLKIFLICKAVLSLNDKQCAKDCGPYNCTCKYRGACKFGRAHLRKTQSLAHAGFQEAQAGF